MNDHNHDLTYISDASHTHPLAITTEWHYGLGYHNSANAISPQIWPVSYPIVAPPVDTHPTERTAPPMRGLYEVFIVDPETDEIVSTLHLLAKDETSARLKAAVSAKLSRDLDDLDIICRQIGQVRPKAKPQDVRVMKG